MNARSIKWVAAALAVAAAAAFGGPRNIGDSGWDVVFGADPPPCTHIVQNYPCPDGSTYACPVNPPFTFNALVFSDTLPANYRFRNEDAVEAPGCANAVP